MKNKSNPMSTALIATACLVALGCGDAPAKKPQPEKPKTESKTSKVIQKALAPEETLATISAPATPTAKTPPTPDAEEPAIKTEPSFEPMLESHGGVAIRRLITAPGVEHREPIAASSQFEREQQIYAFVDARNETDEEAKLIVNFIGPKDQVRGGVELLIPPKVPRWRTWAFTKRANEPGLWRVEVRDVQAKLLGMLSFEVHEGC